MLPEGIVLVQPFPMASVLGVVIEAELNVYVELLGLLVSVVADLWYAYTTAWVCPVAPGLPVVPVFDLERLWVFTKEY